MYILFLLLVFSANADIAKYVSDETTTSTTLASFQEKLKLSCTTKAITYLVQWTTEIHAHMDALSVIVRLQLDDTTTYDEQDWHPTPDVIGGWAVASGFFVITMTSGAHEFDLDFSSGTAGQSVSLRRSRILINEINI